LRLMRAVADAMPDAHIVLIGQDNRALPELEGAPNMHHLQRKPYETLPAYCKGMDVAVLPFAPGALTAASNPLKLREYLAAGLPVVSTDLPEVRKYSGLVRLAAGVEGFVAAIEAALADRGEAAARARVAAMQPESWEARVEQISELLEETEVRA